MKKVKGKNLSGKLFGISSEEHVANYINENNIKQEDIIQIVYNPVNGGYGIFYYVEEA